jgi:hypothetical protein
MKSILTLFILPMFLFCSSKKVDAAKKIHSTTVGKTHTCPSDGKCTVEIFKNKSLEIVKDDIGSIYYKMLESENTQIIKYTYFRNSPRPDYKDGNYSEEIIFEVGNLDKILNLNDVDLQQTKMLFGRFCYCKGQAGYFKISDGNLKLEKKENVIQFNLVFKIVEVPQIINSITEILN